MNSTIKYYDVNSEMFINSSVNADMGEIYKHFLAYIPEGGWILDAGCGSGRDSKCFLDLGYKIEAFDASEEMCRAASTFIDQKVRLAYLEEYSSEVVFDGIWACASLLHVEQKNLVNVMRRLLSYMSSSGVMYCSWKYGDGERIQSDGKYYCDMNETKLAEVVGMANSEILEVWQSKDSRVDNTTQWLNVLIRKKRIC